jgi:hypothetical protein
MNFIGDAVKLDLESIGELAEQFGIELASLRAVIAVESAGSGFDAYGRPKALFERHHFYKYIKANYDQALVDEAVSKKLAYPKWGTLPYPKGSSAVYQEIEAAYEIAPREALLSTSWGMGQVMGSNYAVAGCVSVEEMVDQAMESEELQLKHMLNFINTANLLNKLKAQDWAGFAKGYNGPAYATNQYDTKLEAAYNRYA